MKPSEPPALEINGLTKVYRRSHLGKVTVSRGIQNVSVTVRTGEVFGLLGLNGSGKTTTIKLLLGLLFPTAGSVRVMGRPAGSAEAKTTLGYLPEIPYFYKFLSAREVLRFYGRLSRMDGPELTRRIDDVLAAVRMTASAGRPMRDYSKGMLQRVGLAQAMLHDPALMILDEPVTGLDPLGLKEMRELIASLNQKGKTVFFSSHSISEAEKLCHRVGILVEGRLDRVIGRDEWEKTPGRLETLFVDTVSGGPA
jgi:ABC-2 type transport system ATP-binding protein